MDEKLEQKRRKIAMMSGVDGVEVSLPNTITDESPPEEHPPPFCDPPSSQNSLEGQEEEGEEILRLRDEAQKYHERSQEAFNSLFVCLFVCFFSMV